MTIALRRKWLGKGGKYEAKYIPYMVYKDEEVLELTNKVYLTRLAWKILNKEYLKLRKSGRRISKAKLVCNLIIEKYGNIQEDFDTK